MRGFLDAVFLPHEREVARQAFGFWLVVIVPLIAFWLAVLLLWKAGVIR